MFLREKLQPRIEPPKNLKPPNENNELPITEKNQHEDKRVIVLIAIYLVLSIISVFFLPKDEVRYENQYVVKDVLNGENILINDTFNQIRSDSRFIKMYLNFHNKGSKGRSLYDIGITFIRDTDNASNHLNGTYTEKFIQPTIDQLIFSDESPQYKTITASLKIPAKIFDENSKISIIWALGNPKNTIILVVSRYLAIIYFVLILLYFFKNIGFRSPEEGITFALIIGAIIYCDPFSFLRFYSPSKAYLIISRILSNVFGGILIFALQAVFALSRPCCSEIIEGNAFVGWIFFVVSTFFDVLPYCVTLFNEISFDLAPGVKTFGKVASMMCVFFAFSCFWTQKKEYPSVPPNFRYRFWTIFYHCIVFCIVYSLWKLTFLFTRLLSLAASELIGLSLVVGASMSFASLFWNRSLAPFNLFHNEDSKLKLE